MRGYTRRSRPPKRATTRTRAPGATSNTSSQYMESTAGLPIRCSVMRERRGGLRVASATPESAREIVREVGSPGSRPGRARRRQDEPRHMQRAQGAERVAAGELLRGRAALPTRMTPGITRIAKDGTCVLVCVKSDAQACIWHDHGSTAELILHQHDHTRTPLRDPMLRTYACNGYNVLNLIVRRRRHRGKVSDQHVVNGASSGAHFFLIFSSLKRTWALTRGSCFMSWSFSALARTAFLRV